MIIGTGIDNIETYRIERVIKRYGKRFLDRVYTPEEQTRCERNRFVYQNYASHFAAKEAVMKVLETGASHITPFGVPFRDIEVYYEDSGAPRIRLYRKARKVAEEKEINKIHISLTSLDSICAAYVIGEKSGETN